MGQYCSAVIIFPLLLDGLLYIPEGIHLVMQPPYSPKLRPAEHLCRFADKLLANRYLDYFKQLDGVLVERYITLTSMTGSIGVLTNYHWWP